MTLKVPYLKSSISGYKVKCLDASLAMKCLSSSLPIRYAYSIDAKIKLNYESNEHSIRHFSNQSTLLLPWVPFWMGDFEHGIGVEENFFYKDSV